MAVRATRPVERPPTTELLPGRLVLVVGSSGSATNELIEAARTSLADNPHYVFPRRVVTRSTPAVGGDIVAEDAGFRAVAERGGFVLSWQAQDRLYGIPSAMVADLAAGRTVVIDASRSVIGAARRRWPDVTVVEMTVPAEASARRTRARGRAGDGVGELSRVSRRATCDRPPADATIDDDGALDAALAAFMAAILDA